MVTQITLGNIYQNGGKTVVGGGQSQLDVEGIIKSLTEAKRLPAVRLEDKNKAIDGKLSAYTELKSLLSRFQTSADALRNPPGVNNASQNIFQYRTSTLTSNTGVAASSYLAMTIEPGTATQNFTIDEIEQLATVNKQQSGSFLLPNTTTASVVEASGGTTAGMFSEGTFTLRNLKAPASPVSLTLEEGDSLQTVVNKFNAVKDSTGIQANIVKVATGTPNNTYQITFTATKTGVSSNFDMADIGTVLTDVDGVMTQVTFAPPVAGQNAKMTVDGIAIERETNSIDDLIDGITFNLKQATPALTEITASIVPDTDIVKNAVTAFADVYNEFRLFAAKQMQVGEDGKPSEEAVLAQESFLRTIISQVASEMTRVVNGMTGGKPERLADIGINFSDFAGDAENPATKNIMVIDTDKLASALAADFDGVQELFEFTLSSDNPALAVFKRSNSLSVADFSIDFNGTTATATYEVNGAPVTVDLDVTTNGAGGFNFAGKKGTLLEGLQLIYADTPAATINVTATQGYGDRLFNLMESVLNSVDGSLTNTVKALEDLENRNEKEITKIDSQIEIYRAQLTDQYARLEAALTQANQLLALLDAQASAREAN